MLKIIVIIIIGYTLNYRLPSIGYHRIFFYLKKKSPLAMAFTLLDRTHTQEHQKRTWVVLSYVKVGHVLILADCPVYGIRQLLSENVQSRLD
jgi:hypothetical protein